MNTSIGILDYETNIPSNRSECHDINDMNLISARFALIDLRSGGSTGLKKIKIPGSAASLATVEARSASEGVKGVRSYRSTALISIKKPTKILKSKSNKTHPKMGRAYMIVKYDGENYITHSIIESTDIINAEKEAETKAEQLTLEHNHKKHGYSAVPIHIPGTILIMYLNLQTPIYYKNTLYYATMRSTYGGDTEFRAIALWKTEKDATVFANISKSMKDPKFIYTYIGGPLKV